MRRVVWEAGGFGRQSPDLTDERLGGAGRLRAGMQQLGHRHVDCCVQPFDALDDLMHEPDPERAPSIESGAAGEEGPSLALADLGHHVGRDDRRDDAQTGLGESEGRARLGDDQVGHGTKAHATAESRTLDSCHDRRGTGVHPLEHAGHGLR